MVVTARKTILIVEDNDDLRRIFGDVLKSNGFEVHEAADGSDALRLLDVELPDLILCDIGLPTLDGSSVCNEIAGHERMRHIPVIVVTGMDVDLERLNVKRVLRKPVSPDILLAAVRSLFAS